MEAVRQAEIKGYDVLIVDTAGRLQIDEELMEELVRIKKRLNLTRYFWFLTHLQVRMP